MAADRGERTNDCSGERQDDYYLVNLATMKLSTVASAFTAFWLPGSDQIVYVTPGGLAPLPGQQRKHNVWVQIMFFDSVNATPNAITSGLTNHVDLLSAKAPRTARVSKHGSEVAPRDDDQYFPFARFRNRNFFEWQHRGRPKLSKTQRSHNIRTHKLQSVGLRKCIRQAVMSSMCPEG